MKISFLGNIQATNAQRHVAKKLGELLSARDDIEVFTTPENGMEFEFSKALLANGKTINWLAFSDRAGFPVMPMKSHSLLNKNTKKINLSCFEYVDELSKSQQYKRRNSELIKVTDFMLMPVHARALNKRLELVKKTALEHNKVIYFLETSLKIIKENNLEVISCQ